MLTIIIVIWKAQDVSLRIIQRLLEQEKFLYTLGSDNNARSYQR